MTPGTAYLESVIKRFKNYKKLGEQAFDQLSEEDFFFEPGPSSNNIAIIIQHMAGNMLSRWTNFLTSDGEKEWRNRDIEFENQVLNYQQLLDIWEKGWECCLDSLEALTEDDLLKTIYIRDEPQFVIDAVNRQLAHYPYHVGQIIYIAKIIKGENWQTLSIAKGASKKYNEQMKSRLQ